MASRLYAVENFEQLVRLCQDFQECGRSLFREKRVVVMKAPCRLRQSLRWCRVLMSERLLSLAMSAFLMYAACTRSQTLGWSSTSWVGHEQPLLLLLMVGAAFAKARRESGEVDADIVVMVVVLWCVTGDC